METALTAQNFRADLVQVMGQPKHTNDFVKGSTGGNSVDMNGAALNDASDANSNSEQFLRRKVHDKWKTLSIDFRHRRGPWCHFSSPGSCLCGESPQGRAVDIPRPILPSRFNTPRRIMVCD